MKKVFSIATVVLMLFALALPAYAVDDGNYPTTYPTVSGVKSTHRVVVYDETNDRYLLYLLSGILYNNVRFQVQVNNNGTYNLVGTGTGNVTFKVYKYKSGVDEWWAETSKSDFSSPSAVSIPSTSFSDIKDANYNISTTEGDAFFLPPTADTMAKVMCLIRREMVALRPNLTRTMLTLTLCGVGCLAFLISLKVLPKVLSRFHS